VLVNKFFVRRDPYRFGVGLFIAQKDMDGHIAVATNITYQVIEPGEIGPDAPVLTMREDEAQELMDALWTVGLRPTEGSGSAGSLKATQDHLADMRAIVAKTLEVKL
jgi:hypothetical protein